MGPRLWGQEQAGGAGGSGLGATPGRGLDEPLHPATKRCPSGQVGASRGTSSDQRWKRKGSQPGHVGVMEAALAVLMPDRIEFIEIKKVRLAQKEDWTTKELCTLIFKSQKDDFFLFLVCAASGN